MCLIDLSVGWCEEGLPGLVLRGWLGPRASWLGFGAMR